MDNQAVIDMVADIQKQEKIMLGKNYDRVNRKMKALPNPMRTPKEVMKGLKTAAKEFRHAFGSKREKKKTYSRAMAKTMTIKVKPSAGARARKTAVADHLERKKVDKASRQRRGAKAEATKISKPAYGWTVDELVQIKETAKPASAQGTKI